MFPKVSQNRIKIIKYPKLDPESGSFLQSRFRAIIPRLGLSASVALTFSHATETSPDPSRTQGRHSVGHGQASQICETKISLQMSNNRKGEHTAEEAHLTARDSIPIGKMSDAQLFSKRLKIFSN